MPAKTKTKRTTDPLAIELNELHRRIATGEESAVAAKLTVGWKLRKKKDELPHGEFLPWVAANCDFSERTAQNYMAASRAVHGDGPNPQPLAATPKTIVKLYTITKKKARDIRRGEAGTIHLSQQLYPIADDIHVHHVPGGIEDMDQHVRPHSARLMVIDPPYHTKHRHLYTVAAEKATKWLKAGGVALVYCPGGRGIGDVFQRFAAFPQLVFQQRFEIYFDEAKPFGWTKDFMRPVLVFSLGKRYRHPGKFVPTMLKSQERLDRDFQHGKRHHDWGQDFNSLACWVSQMTRPGDLVVDPFVGGGTTPAVCRAIGHRRCIAGDINPLAKTKTEERLERTKPGSYRHGKPQPAAKT